VCTLSLSLSHYLVVISLDVSLSLSLANRRAGINGSDGGVWSGAAPQYARVLSTSARSSSRARPVSVGRHKDRKRERERDQSIPSRWILEATLRAYDIRQVTSVPRTTMARSPGRSWAIEESRILRSEIPRSLRIEKTVCPRSGCLGRCVHAQQQSSSDCRARGISRVESRFSPGCGFSVEISSFSLELFP